MWYSYDFATHLAVRHIDQCSRKKQLSSDWWRISRQSPSAPQPWFAGFILATLFVRSGCRLVRPHTRGRRTTYRLCILVSEGTRDEVLTNSLQEKPYIPGVGQEEVPSLLYASYWPSALKYILNPPKAVPDTKEARFLFLGTFLIHWVPRDQAARWF